MGNCGVNLAGLGRFFLFPKAPPLCIILLLPLAEEKARETAAMRSKVQKERMLNEKKDATQSGQHTNKGQKSRLEHASLLCGLRKDKP
ncbi:hypothetical protein Fmac_008482 [Flemingia macrophylla]|uniref:Small EDRK-rich factor-like N-terminal domain-containing protein n=1 Tax=Flemingia macrophylla TaxID=520843 RepID=A0ABD1MXI2_9FABA